MTYRELSKELGINGSKLAYLEKTGLLKSKGTAALIGNIDDEDADVIRKYCLFSMLGVSDDETTGILTGNADLKQTLKKHVDDILSDDSNPTQAAIVLQGIRRECNSIEDLDARSFLLQIKELKHSGGLFYDVNTLKLQDKKETQNISASQTKSRKSLFGFLEFKNSEQDSHNSGEYRDVRNTENSKAENPEPETDNSFRDGNPDNENASDNEKAVGDGIDSADRQEEQDTEQTASGSDDTENNNPDRDEQAETKEEEGNPKNIYEEGWSPYTNRGFGASNMGSGNWHGWSPGYGTYSQTVGARVRINNGEKTCPHPFRRFAARAFDTTLVTIIIGAVMRLAFRINIGKDIKMMAYCEIIFWLFEMMIEPLLLSTIGTTPGKYIMGVKVRDMKTKGKLDIKQAYVRTLKLAWQGFGFMIPIYTLFKRAMSFMRCKINDTMPWDTGIDVELSDEAPARLIICIIVIIALNVGDEMIAKQALIPKNRGEITKEQFFENVSEIMKYSGYGGEMPDFIIREQNGYVKTVSLHYDADDKNVNRYNEMYLGFLAFAGSTDSSNGFTLMLNPVMNRMKLYYTAFEDEYCGVKLVNESDSGIIGGNSYSQLLSLFYDTEVTVTDFNQTFTMSK